MKIAVDTTSWANARGYGRFVRELLPELTRAGSAHEFRLLVEAENAARVDVAGANVEVVPVALSAAPTTAAGAGSARSPVDLWRLNRAARALAADVLFYPTVYTWFPPPRGLANLVCVHDAIAERFPELCFNGARARCLWNVKVRWALRRSRLVLTVSEFAARDIARTLGVERGRLRVTSEAPGAAFAPAAADDRRAARARHGLGSSESFLIYVGGLNPHKRLDLVFAALARLGSDAPRLVLAGPTDDAFFRDDAALAAARAKLPPDRRPLSLGFVPDRELAALLSDATALLLPSMCEGYGLPAIEAAACGTPVVATSESPLPELLAEGGLFVEPGDLDGLTAAIRSVSMDRVRRDRLAARALERARALSWARAASSTLSAIEESA